MNRIAILIGSPSEPYLQGVAHDLENMKSFLMSSNGGAWDNDEIHIPRLDPSAQEINHYLRSCERYDFAFIYFSGHGFTNKNENAAIALNTKEKVLVKDLANRCKKQITIIDACRGYSDYSNFTGLSGIGKIDFDYANLGVSRTIFKDYTEHCSDGRVLLYASQKGQNAEDTNQGGYFSTNLLISAQELANTSQQIVSNICDIFNQTYTKTQNKHQPDIEYTNKTALNLPFVIKSSSQIALVRNSKNVETKNILTLTNQELLGITLGTVAIIGVTALLVDVLTGNKK